LFAADANKTIDHYEAQLVTPAKFFLRSALTEMLNNEILKKIFFLHHALGRCSFYFFSHGFEVLTGAVRRALFFPLSAAKVLKSNYGKFETASSRALRLITV
jgi:uncharacterized protein YaaW (UPF0174 family)